MPHIHMHHSHEYHHPHGLISSRCWRSAERVEQKQNNTKKHKNVMYECIHISNVRRWVEGKKAWPTCGIYRMWKCEAHAAIPKNIRKNNKTKEMKCVWRYEKFYVRRTSEDKIFILSFSIIYEWKNRKSYKNILFNFYLREISLDQISVFIIKFLNFLGNIHNLIFAKK